MRRSPPGTCVDMADAGGRFRASVPSAMPPEEHLGIVAELTNRQRGRVFAYRRYVDELAPESESVT